MVSNVGVKLTRLISKSVGNAVKAGTKVPLGKGEPLLPPSGAKTFDLVEGIGAKGKRFLLGIFKNKNGETLSQTTRFSNGTEIHIERTANKVLNSLDTTRTVTVNGVKKNVSHTSLSGLSGSDGSVNIVKSFTNSGNSGNYGGYELLRPGQSPRGVSYQYKYDGSPATINYKNMQGKKLNLSEEELQYLPFATQRAGLVLNPQGQPNWLFLSFPVGNVEKEVALAQKIQERVHGIMGILPKAKVANLENISNFEHGGICDTFGTLQIKLSPKLLDKTSILDTMAHEVQHAADAIKGFRVTNSWLTANLGRLSKAKKYAKFFKKHDNPAERLGAEILLRTSIPRRKVFQKLGNMKIGSPEYQEAFELRKLQFQCLTPEYKLASKAEHDAFPVEQRAIKREGEELNKLGQIASKILNFIIA